MTVRMCTGVVWTLKPIIDLSSPIEHYLELEVQASQPVSLELGGPGVEESQDGAIHLGEALSVIELRQTDSTGAKQLSHSTGIRNDAITQLVQTFQNRIGTAVPPRCCLWWRGRRFGHLL